MVGDAGDARMHIAATEILGADDFTGCGLHQRRTAEEDRALVADDHRLVRHRRHVRATGGARAHHAGDLRDRKSTRLNSSHYCASRLPSSACKKTRHTTKTQHDINSLTT